MDRCVSPFSPSLTITLHPHHTQPPTFVVVFDYFRKLLAPQLDRFVHCLGDHIIRLQRLGLGLRLRLRLRLGFTLTSCPWRFSYARWNSFAVFHPTFWSPGRKSFDVHIANLILSEVRIFPRYPLLITCRYFLRESVQ